VTKGNTKRSVWVALIAPIVVLALATSAAATEKEHHWEGEYAKFDQCPAENPNADACFLAEAHGGEFQIGNIDTPIARPILLQGALRFDEETGEGEVIPATNGETLMKVPQVVPEVYLRLSKKAATRGTCGTSAKTSPTTPNARSRRQRNSPASPPSTRAICSKKWAPLSKCH
jgi:hypothetical protein